MSIGTEPSFDPTPPPHGVQERRWWGRPVAELRWQAELARLFVDPVYRGVGVPRGTGEPVVCIPGFLAGDLSLSVMRDWLQRMGYDARPADIAYNVDCSDRALDRLDELVGGVHAETGRRVALIGHSRGGHFAKALGNRRPDRVSAVISLGSVLDTPFDISLPTKAAVAAVRGVPQQPSARIARNGCFPATCRCRFTRDFVAAPTVPLTSIYSRGDGVVWWE